MTKGDKTVKVMNGNGPLGFAFFLAYIGAAVYYVHQSEGFWGFIWALIKAIAWPAAVVYHVLNNLNV